MNGLRVSPAGLALIKRFESFSPTVYTCPAGKLTIGYGHVVSMQDRIIQPITIERAEELLAADLSWVEEDLNALPVPLTQGQFDALASLTYNIGRGAFAGSTLKKRLLAHDFIAARAEFQRWVYATVGGTKKILMGLVNRRFAEAQMFGGKALESPSPSTTESKP